MLGIKKHVHLLGYRENMAELYKISDLFVLPSFREGLSRSLMEAMVFGLPCVCSKIGGDIDLIIEGEGGLLYSPNDINGFAEAINFFIK